MTEYFAPMRVSFWRLFPEFRSNEGNKHQIILKWAYRQFATTVYTLSYVLNEYFGFFFNSLVMHMNLYKYQYLAIWYLVLCLHLLHIWNSALLLAKATLHSFSIGALLTLFNIMHPYLMIKRHKCFTLRRNFDTITWNAWYTLSPLNITVMAVFFVCYYILLGVQCANPF